MSLASGLSGITSYAGYYASQRQSLLLACSSTVAVPAGLALSLTFSAGVVVAGSAILRSHPSAAFAYPSDSSLTVSSMPAISSATTFTLQLTLEQPSSSFSLALAGSLSTTRTTLLGTQLASTSQLFSGSLSVAGQQTQPLPARLAVNPSAPAGVHEMGTAFVLAHSGTSATGLGSRLVVLLPSAASVSSPTLLYNGGASALTLAVATAANYLQLTFSSPAGQNLFPNSAVTLSLSGLTFAAASSDRTHYELFYQLFYDQTLTSFDKGQASFTVVPARGVAGLSLHLSNDAVAADAAYPNVLRLLSTSALTYSLTASQQRVIEIRSSTPLDNLLSLANQQPYPCQASVPITCTYYEGAQASQLGSEQLAWPRVRVLFGGAEATASSFHAVLPLFFGSTAPVSFEVLLGTLDSGTGLILFSGALAAPVSGSSTYFTPASVIQRDVSGNIVYMGGTSASIANNVEVAIESTSTYTGTTASAALLVVAKWPVFSSSWASGYQFNGAAATLKDSALQLSYTAGAQAYYLSYQPLYSAAAITTHTFFWSGVQYPFSSDLPFYTMFLVSSTGQMDCRYEYANAFPDSFYRGTLSSLEAACLSQRIGTLNTRCTLIFQTSSVTLQDAVMKVATQGLTIFTSLCALAQGSTAVPVSCQSSVDGLLLSITLTGAASFPPASQFTLTLHGVAITSTFPTLTLSIADSSGTYTLEQGQRILATQPAAATAIAINSLALSVLNPLAVTRLTLNFTTPRLLLDDERLQVELANDFNDVNTDPLQVDIQLATLSGTAIPLTFSFSNLAYLLEMAPGLVSAGTYLMTVSGLIAPASTTSKVILNYLRTHGSFVSLANLAASTPSYPVLRSATTSTITLTAALLATEGLPQDLTFTVALGAASAVDYNSSVVVRLPSYYSVSGWNLPPRYCEVNGQATPCRLLSPSPYALQLYNIPAILQAASSFTFSVFGLTTPQQALVAANPALKFFVGISCGKDDPFFCEYANVNAPAVAAITAVGQIVLHSAITTNLHAQDRGFYTLVLSSTVAVAAGQKIFLNFPSAFTAFNGQTL